MALAPNAGLHAGMASIYPVLPRAGNSLPSQPANAFTHHPSYLTLFAAIGRTNAAAVRLLSPQDPLRSTLTKLMRVWIHEFAVRETWRIDEAQDLVTELIDGGGIYLRVFDDKSSFGNFVRKGVEAGPKWTWCLG